MTAIRRLAYQPPREASPVETMSFSRLRHLDNGSTQRGDFHVLAVVRRGRGRVSIDFSEHPLAARTVVWIRPGVVHRWDQLGMVSGELVLFVPTAPLTAASRDLAAAPGTSACWPAWAPEWPLLTAALGHLRIEAGARPDGRTGELLGLLLSALVLRAAPPAGTTQRPGGDRPRRQGLPVRAACPRGQAAAGARSPEPGPMRGPAGLSRCLELLGVFPS